MLSIHTKNSHTERDYPCKVCSRVFHDRMELKTHLAIHSAEGPHKCCVCLKTFRFKMNLEKHRLVHAKKSNRCKECNVGFTNKFDAKTHMRIMHPVEVEHECLLCQERFDSKMDLTKHVRDRHRTAVKAKEPRVMEPDERPHVCIICSKAFRLRKHLVRHLKDLHQTVRSDSISNKQLDTASCTKLIKSGGVEHEHPIYPEHSESKAELSDHVKSHKRAKTTELELSQESTKRKVRRHRCNICQKIFRFEKTLEKHQKIHWKKGDKKNCDGSAIEQPTKVEPKFVSFQKHVDSQGESDGHAKDQRPKTKSAESPPEKKIKEYNSRPHECEVCQKTFRFEKTLERHVTIHKKDVKEFAGNETGSLATKSNSESGSGSACICATGMEQECVSCKERCDSKAEFTDHGKRRQSERGQFVDVSWETFCSEQTPVEHKKAENSLCAIKIDAGSDKEERLGCPTEVGEEDFTHQEHFDSEKELSSLVGTQNQLKTEEKHLHPGATDSKNKEELVKCLYKCDICEKVFGFKKNLTRHKFLLHPKDSKRCRSCRLPFNSNSENGDHIGVVDRSNLKDYCSSCKEGFPRKSTSKKHTKQYTQKKAAVVESKNEVLLDRQSHKCSVCQKIFRSKKSLTKHQRIHLNNSNKCDVCDMIFADKLELESHTAIVHSRGGEHRCLLCKGCFGSKAELKKHAISHKEEKESNKRQHRCVVCSKSFRFKKSLIQHQSVHSRKMPNFSRLFVKKTEENSDVKSEPKEECSVCHERFDSRIVLEEHFDNTHRTEDAPTAVSRRTLRNKRDRNKKTT